MQKKIKSSGIFCFAHSMTTLTITYNILSLLVVVVAAAAKLQLLDNSEFLDESNSFRFRSTAFYS